MKKSIGLVLVHVALTFALVGCKSEVASDNVQAFDVVDEDALSVDSAIGQINESAEDLSDNSGFSQKVSVSSCVQNGPNSSALNLLYESHQIAGTNIKVDGSVERVYSNSICSFANPGDAFLRAHELRFSSLYREGALTTSSSPVTNYLGQVVSGGESLLKTQNGFELVITGNNQKLTSGSGRKLFDISIVTTVPLQFDGTISRLNRNLVSGQIQIFHNLAKYKATHTFQNLQWTDSCKCPVSGRVEVDFEGSRSGGASITINGCGLATMVTDQGVSKELDLARCQVD